LLEWIDGLQLRHVGSFDTWLLTASWIGAFHRQTLPSVEQPDLCSRLLLYDASFYNRWAKRSAPALEKLELTSSEICRLAECHEKAVDVLESLPKTVLHGELYPSNVVVSAYGLSQRVAVIDWEAAAIGPAVVDIAALATGAWSPNEVEKMINAHEEAAGAAGSPADERDLAFASARLHLAFRWLGWSMRWAPPTDLCHDWLSEARLAAQTLSP
jgi:aminoglycoside/choline kinase family phosphotransferase